MGVLHPQELDPQEELWFPVNWTNVLFANEENIQTSSWTPSSEAILDGHTKLLDEATNVATNVKLTGGMKDATYAWTHIVTTLDPEGRTARRKRTIIIKTVEK